MSTKAALTDLQNDKQKKKLPSILDRRFVQVTSECDKEEDNLTVMQWNVLAQGAINT